MSENPRDGLRHKRTLADGSPAPLRGETPPYEWGRGDGLSTRAAETARRIRSELDKTEKDGTPLTDEQKKLRDFIEKQYPYLVENK